MFDNILQIFIIIFKKYYFADCKKVKQICSFYINELHYHRRTHHFISFHYNNDYKDYYR